MGIKDAIARFLGKPKCEKLIHYDTRSIDMGALSVDVAGAKFSLASFKTSIQKVREASETADSIDDYQYDLCTISSEYDKGDPERVQCNKWRIGALSLFTSLRMTLASLQADESDEMKKQLESVVQDMHDYMKAIAKAVTTTTAPVNAPLIRGSIEGGRMSPAPTGKREIKTLGKSFSTRDVPSRALRIAGLKPGDLESIAKQA